MKKVTLNTLRKKKREGVPVSFITAYDYPSATFVNRAGIDMILVGDSGGMAMLGYKNTLAVTMDEMLQFAKSVNRVQGSAFVVGDMPYMSYQVSNEEAVRNAGRFMSEAGCDAVKLEGGVRMCERVHAIVDAGIPVMGHLGMTPQSMAVQSGYTVQGKKLEGFKVVLEDAIALKNAGASFILLEAMPEGAGELIRDALDIPIYGIGAGSKLDGQLLIFHDLMGTFVGDIEPKFAKKYLEGAKLMTEALSDYHKEVVTGVFPGPSHVYKTKPEDLEEMRELMK
jgi:3-methyl-2-oxobutanoate hydroxymethyltransferase